MKKIIGSFILFLSLTDLKSEANDAVKGQSIAEKVCASCHVVPSGSKFGGIGSTLSFRGLRNLPDWRERFETFYSRRPHAAFVEITGVISKKESTYAKKITLVPADINHLVAFAETLKIR